MEETRQKAQAHIEKIGEFGIRDEEMAKIGASTIEEVISLFGEELEFIRKLNIVQP